MVGMFGGQRAIGLRLAAVALVAPECYEVAYGNQAPGERQGGVTRLVPIRIILTPNDVKEIAFRKAEFPLLVLCGVIVEGADNLCRSHAVSYCIRPSAR